MRDRAATSPDHPGSPQDAIAVTCPTAHRIYQMMGPSWTELNDGGAEVLRLFIGVMIAKTPLAPRLSPHLNSHAVINAMIQVVNSSLEADEDEEDEDDDCESIITDSDPYEQIANASARP